MKDFFNTLDSKHRALIGIFLIIVGVYLITHCSMEKDIAISYIIFGPMLILRGLAFLSI